MYKIDIEIDGMMCGMCEAHVADVIRKTVNDARKVAVSHTKGTAVFLTEEKPDEDKIKDAIDATGYTVMSMKCDIYRKKNIYVNFVSQTRKPEGSLGKIMVNSMNGGHAKMADWGLSHLKDIDPKDIVEIGCGGGRNAGELLKKYPDSHVLAVDYSEVSVNKTKEYNKAMIERGRCTVRQVDVSSLDLPLEKYDLATAFETIYFWPGLGKCFLEVAKVLKTGGSFMIVNESDGKDETSLKYEKIIDGMRCYTPETIGNTLLQSGFSAVEIHHHDSKPWICVIAKK